MVGEYVVHLESVQFYKLSQYNYLYLFLPDGRILALSKLKETADDIFSVAHFLCNVA